MTYRQAVVKVLRENGLSEQAIKACVHHAMRTLPTPQVEMECVKVYDGLTEEQVLDKIRKDMRDFGKLSRPQMDELMTSIHQRRAKDAENN